MKSYKYSLPKPLSKWKQRLESNIAWQLGRWLSRMEQPAGEKRIAIFRIDAIGDFILFAPALKFLREKYRDFRITLVLQERVKQLAEGCPFVDDIITFEERRYQRNLIYRLKFLGQLAKAGFSIALYPVYSRGSIGDEMVLWTGAAQKIGWESNHAGISSQLRHRNNRIYSRLFRSNSLRIHELQRNREFLNHLGIEVQNLKPELWPTENGRARAEDIFPQSSATKHLIAILPGALDANRQWGAPNYSLFMQRLAAMDEKVFFVLIGGRGEGAGLGLGNGNGEGRCLDLCGKTNLRELPHIFAKCQAVVGNETGPMHLAMAAGTPTLCILGGGHYGRFMPYGDPQRNRFLYHKMDCYYCNWRCRYEFPKCITNISVNEVLAELTVLLKK